nr:hypothetical protein [Kibdelosporangium sp. MJ126-NF4]
MLLEAPHRVFVRASFMRRAVRRRANQRALFRALAIRH